MEKIGLIDRHASLNDEIQTGPGVNAPGPVCLGLFTLRQI